MTNHKPAIINPVMGQSAPFTQHQQAGNRHPANRHRHTPKKPRYAHKVQQQGKEPAKPAPPLKPPKIAQIQGQIRQALALVVTITSHHASTQPNPIQNSVKERIWHACQAR